MGQKIQIVGAVALAVALSGAQSGNPIAERSGQEDRTAETRTEANEKVRTPPPTVEDSLQRIATQLAAQRVDPDARLGEARAQRDLDAQEDMAWWAMWMFFAATAGTILSAVGVFLIWRTLLYTRDAAKHTRTAVEDMRAQTAGHIRIDSAELRFDPSNNDPPEDAGAFLFDVGVANIGATRANILEIKAIARIDGGPAELVETGTARRDLSSETAMTYRFGSDVFTVSTSGVIEQRYRETPLRLVVRIAYVDIYGRKEWAEQAFECPVPVPIRNPEPRGNPEDALLRPIRSGMTPVELRPD